MHARAFKLCHCVQYPSKLTTRHFWSSRNERKPLSKLKHVLRKCSGVSQKWWILEISNLCHYVQHPWKLTSRDYWSSRNERKPLSKLKHVFEENAVEVSQKWWMLELSNLCHYVQHPWKLTSRDFWSTRNERKPLSKLKHVLRKCSKVSQKSVNARAFKPLPLCSVPLRKLTGLDFWNSRNERKTLSKQKCVLRKCSKVSQKQCMLELSNLCHCVQYPSKLTSRDFWSSRNERKPLSKQKCVLWKCCGVSQKWWILELSKLCHYVQHPWKLTSRDYWSSRNERKPLSKLKHVLRKCSKSISEISAC